MDRRADYLKSVLSAVRSDLAPELSSDMARHRVDLIDLVATRLIADFSVSPELVAEYRAAVAGAVGDVAAPPASTLAKTIQEIAQAIDGTGASREEAPVSAAMRALLQEVIDHPGATADRPAREQLVRVIAGAEAGYRNAFEAHVTAEGQSIRAAQAAAAPDRKINETSLTAYLRRRFPDTSGIRAEAVKPIPGGRSKGTTLYTQLCDDAPPREIIIRQDFPAQVAGLPVTYEYPLLKALWGADLQIAEPLWCEETENELGGPFATFAKSPGKPGGTLFSMGTPASGVRDMAAFFGKLHSVDIDKGGLRDMLLWGKAESPTRDMLDFYYAKWIAVRGAMAPSTLIETAFLWLYDHLDVIDPKPAFVHGDSSYHNVLIHEGRLSAVLDWEYAHAGDPAEDLLGSEHYTTQMLPWDEFMKIYRDNGGRDISKGRFHFFALWRSLRFTISTCEAGYVYNTGVNRDLRLATISYTTTPRLLADVARQLAAASGL